MNVKRVRCSNCGKTFLPTGKSLEIIVDLAGKGASLAMIECAVCGITTNCNPLDIVPGSQPSSTPQPTFSDIRFRCPTLGCVAWVHEINDGEDVFWGCGECGDIWRGQQALDRAISHIVKMFPHRKKVYVRTGKHWSFVPESQEPKNYEELVGKENDSDSQKVATRDFSR